MNNNMNNDNLANIFNNTDSIDDTNNENNVDNTQPYRAMGNMNTVISNPSANINNTMSVNIASAGEPASPSVQETPIQESPVQPSAPVETPAPQEEVETGEVNKTFVSDAQPKKRTISLNLGKEFKIALFIVVILLIFVFLLPLLP